MTAEVVFNFQSYQRSRAQFVPLAIRSSSHKNVALKTTKPSPDKDLIVWS